MAKTNVPVQHESVKTHEGGPAQRASKLMELRRTLSTCLLWEDTFYEGGQSIAKRLHEQANGIPFADLAPLIIKAKDELFLRHAPMWLAVRATQLHKGQMVGQLISNVIRRADELAEFLSMYWKVAGKDAPLTKQTKVGLAMAFGKFNAYQFAKYNRDGEVKLKDAMFMVHPKPENHDREMLYKQIASDTLPIPNTWENRITECHTDEEKCAVWTDMLNKGELGALALIRNLRNMEKVSVSRQLVIGAINAANPKGILPHQLVSAWRNAPAYAQAIDELAMKSLANEPRLPSTTIVVVDVSGSMAQPLSNKSEVTRMDAACALASHIVGVAEDSRVFSFSDNVKEVQPVKGFGLIAAIINSQDHRNTHLLQAIESLNKYTNGVERVIVITDEQAQADDWRYGGAVLRKMPASGANHSYILNVASYQYGIARDQSWKLINGFSPAVVRWVMEEEASPLFDKE